MRLILVSLVARIGSLKHHNTIAFHVISEQNCILECAFKHVADFCPCVPWFLHNYFPDKDICHILNIHCYEAITEERYKFMRKDPEAGRNATVENQGSFGLYTMNIQSSDFSFFSPKQTCSRAASIVAYRTAIALAIQQ